MEHVGYQLIEMATGRVVEQWGGVYGQCPGIPEVIKIPNGDVVHCPQIDVIYSSCRLLPWMMDAPPAEPELSVQDQIAALRKQIDDLAQKVA